MKVALDTNLPVRLLTNDDIAQAARVEAWLVANATPQLPAYVDHVVLCELGWVLERSYAYSRTHVHAAIAALLEYDVLSSRAVDSPIPASLPPCPLKRPARARHFEYSGSSPWAADRPLIIEELRRLRR